MGEASQEKGPVQMLAAVLRPLQFHEFLRTLRTLRSIGLLWFLLRPSERQESACPCCPFWDGWGPNYSISTVRGRSDLYILNAANHIIRGEAVSPRPSFFPSIRSCLTMLHEILSDMMLSGGSDSVIIPVGLGGFVACKALSQRNTEPTKVLHPGNHSKMNLAKSMTGRLLGAHGAVEAVATVQGFRTGWVHPNLNLENPDDGVVCCSSPTFLRQHFHMQRVSSPLDSHVYF
ncbi:3-oxoacyl-[acyl-carrier-protein] synthase II, chloroplastic-like isoform X3 [Primulina tabacum]|uniref:3-oxoacyl-[acyl-carrier-protein] synthase II, chloroplastic-like isoform X3 n=1 Tax=Primulina tabacum TaxID=48773 RepID=UPI003F59DC83